MDLQLSGKACVVTGASRGIGLATALRLCGEGAVVVLTARSEEDLAIAASACAAAAAGGEGAVATLALDVTCPDAAPRILEFAAQRFGAVDVLVNNAGSSSTRALADLTDAEWQAQWELNVLAPMRLMRAAGPAMARRGWGRIVNVSSSSGKRPGLNNAAYSVTKSAQLSLSRVFADAYAPAGVLVNAIAPGPVATPLWMGAGGLAEQAAERSGGTPEEAVAAMAQRIPLGRLADEDEVAAVIVFLCSALASAVAGAAWSVDGGYAPLFI